MSYNCTKYTYMLPPSLQHMFTASTSAFCLHLLLILLHLLLLLPLLPLLPLLLLLPPQLLPAVSKYHFKHIAPPALNNAAYIRYLKYKYTLEITMDNSIKGKPTFKYFMNVIGYPSLPAKPATIKLALAPINVPLPPRQAPKAKLHHNGSKLLIPILPIS